MLYLSAIFMIILWQILKHSTEKFTAFIKSWEHGPSTLKERIAQENSRIKQVCLKYYIETSSMANNRPSFENVGNFYANVDQNLGWCLIPKVKVFIMLILITRNDIFLIFSHYSYDKNMIGRIIYNESSYNEYLRKIYDRGNGVIFHGKE